MRKMVNRLIIFLLRKRFGLKKFELFQFVNQKSTAVYYFADMTVVKVFEGHTTDSHVSLNWLLNDKCKVKKVEWRES